MSQWQVAVVREQGVTFGVVCVKDYVLNDPAERQKLVNWWSLHLGCSTVLMGASNGETFGRKDIVEFLQTVHPSQLPWRYMNVAA